MALHKKFPANVHLHLSLSARLAIIVINRGDIVFMTSEFSPLPLCSNPRIQTALGVMLPVIKGLPDHRCQIISTPERDELLLFENKPEVPNGRRVLLIHGLGGSHTSTDLQRIGAKLLKLGYTVYRLNLRGAGMGHRFAQRTYHAGLSEDVHTVLDHLGNNSPLFVVGISLGGNLALKTTAERFYPHIAGTIAVCPPIDVQQTATYMCRRENFMFNRYFCYHLRAHLKNFTGPWFEQAKKIVNMIDYDENITAPMWSYPSARAYYEDASSLPILSQIQRPTLIIGALDDPIVDHRPLNKIKSHQYIDLAISNHGGHVGFVGARGRWMDKVLIDWIVSKH